MTITIPALSTHWKSSLSGILTSTMAVTAGLMAYPPVMAHPKWLAIGGGIQIVMKIWVSAITKDADKITTPDIQKANATAAKENAK